MRPSYQLMLSYGAWMNRGTWNRLPPDIQEAIMSVSGMYGAEWLSETLFSLEVQDAFKVRFKEEGHELEEVTLPPEELQRWEEIAKQVWDD